MKSFVKSKEPVTVEATTTVAGEAPVTTVHDPVAESVQPTEALETAAPVAALTAPPVPAALPSVVHSTYVTGAIASSDIKKPYLSCVQNVGPKSQLYHPGTLVIGDVAICKAPTEMKAPTSTIRVVFGAIDKSFVEWLKYNPSPEAPKPKIFRDPADVVRNGGTIEWRGNIQPSYYPRLTCAMLVRQPADCIGEEAFGLIDGEHAYAAAMISFQRTSYGAAKTLLTDLHMSLNGDPTAAFYDLKWSREVRGGNLVWVPTLTRVRGDVPSESLRNRVRSLTGVAPGDDYEE